MNKRKLDILEKAFACEIGSALNSGIPILQTKSKLANELVDEEMLIEVEATLPGRLPVKIKGFCLTHLGRITYCESCFDD